MLLVSTSNPKRSGNPARRARVAAEESSATREQVNKRSRGLLTRLSRLPPLVIPVVVLVLMLVGLTAPLYLAVPALIVIVTFVIWLAYLSWPALDNRKRIVRGILLAAVVALALGRVTGWL